MSSLDLPDTTPVPLLRDVVSALDGVDMIIIADVLARMVGTVLG